MTPELELLVAFVVFLSLIVVGMSVPFAILLPGVLYLYLLSGWAGFKALGVVSWANLNSFTLTAIPLFILMAEILERGGLIQRTYNALARLMSPVPGGLLQTNIFGCAVFAAVSGSSVTTAAAIGTSALPQLLERGYSKKLAAGSLAAGGTLGILIPPSLAMIIYSTFTETSVSQLFLAGVIPGAILTTMFMAYIAVKALVQPHLAPRERGPESFRQGLGFIVALLPLGFLIAVTMGSIYTGLATPTEAAAIGCVVAIVLSVAFGSLDFRGFLFALRRTTLVTGNIMFLVFSAYVFSHAISMGGVGESFTNYVIGLDLNKVEFLIVLFILYSAMGALVESLGMIVITVPLVFPILAHYGIDPIWFGVILVVFMEMGQITPPIGINLFVIQSLWRGTLKDVVIGTVPFHAMMFALILLLLVFPELALWLPGK